VSFAGASGTLAALEGRGLEVADALADSLQLGRQQVPWHAARDNIAEIGGVLALLTGSLGKFAEDLISLGQSEVREVSLSAAGGSSTMPHKSNPVAPETILALSKVATAQAGLLETAMLHKGERDGSAWAIEWHALPQLLGAVGGALRHGVELAREMTPNPERMLASIESTKGLMFAEAATFALAQVMSRPDAQKLVKAACGEAVESNADLRVILEPQAALDWDAVFAVEQQMGVAGEFASRFVQNVLTGESHCARISLLPHRYVGFAFLWPWLCFRPFCWSQMLVRDPQILIRSSPACATAQSLRRPKEAVCLMRSCWQFLSPKQGKTSAER